MKFLLSAFTVIGTSLYSGATLASSCAEALSEAGNPRLEGRPSSVMTCKLSASDSLASDTYRELCFGTIKNSQGTIYRFVRRDFGRRYHPDIPSREPHLIDRQQNLILEDGRVSRIRTDGTPNPDTFQFFDKERYSFQHAVYKRQYGDSLRNVFDVSIRDRSVVVYHQSKKRLKYRTDSVYRYSCR